MLPAGIYVIYGHGLSCKVIGNNEWELRISTPCDQLQVPAHGHEIALKCGQIEVDLLIQMASASGRSAAMRRSLSAERAASTTRPRAGRTAMW